MSANFKVDRHWFREQMARVNMSQYTLAMRIGMNTGSLSRTLSGQRRLQISEARLIAAELQAPVTEVLKCFDIGTQDQHSSLIVDWIIHDNCNMTKLDKPLEIEHRFSGVMFGNAAQYRKPGNPLDRALVIYDDVSTIRVEKLAIIVLKDESRVIGSLSSNYDPKLFDLITTSGHLIPSKHVKDCFLVKAVLPL
jgi:transcriptional regulator with XRE-family HTH domain